MIREIGAAALSGEKQQGAENILICERWKYRIGAPIFESDMSDYGAKYMQR